MPSLDHALDLDPFGVDRIVLMRSTLTNDGAEHREAASFPLSGT
jgi:2'-5' RNA ligase